MIRLRAWKMNAGSLQLECNFIIINFYTNSNVLLQSLSSCQGSKHSIKKYYGKVRIEIPTE